MLDVPARNAAAEAPTPGRRLSIIASGGMPMGATLFEPSRPAPSDAPLIVIGCAAGVPSRYYARFAAYVAERGHPVLTWDYRGMGLSRAGSLQGSPIRMRDWCTIDTPGVIDWATRTYPERPLHWLGHSLGGFATGLAHNNTRIDRQLSVATLSGYWGRMAAPERYRVRLLMRFLAPPVVWAKGYFPGVLMGGEDLPGPAFLEWMGWCMEPEFLFGDDTLPERRHFPEFRAPIRFVQVADDPWGTPAAVGHMAKHFSASVDRSIWRVTPTEAGVQKIGHFGFFRPDLRDTLWRQAATWLLAVQTKPA